MFNCIEKCGDARKAIRVASKEVEAIALDIFADKRWKNNNGLYLLMISLKIGGLLFLVW
jgi:hypothetical protein